MTRLLRMLPVVLLAALALTACHRRARAGQATVVATTSGGVAVQPTTISHRHYRNLVRVAARDMQCHHSEVAPQEVSPGIFAVSGCGQLREYVMVCTHRRHCRWVGVQPVEQVAMTETRCMTGQIVVQPTGPLARSVSACGQTLQYALACGPGACGWTRGATSGAVMMQAEPGTAVIVIPEGYGPQAQVAVQESAPGQVGDEQADVVQIGAADTLQSLLATQVAAIQACTQGQTVTLQMRWSAQGQVAVGLAPPFAGTAVEQCVQTAVGAVVLQGVTSAGAVQATF